MRERADGPKTYPEPLFLRCVDGPYAGEERSTGRFWWPVRDTGLRLRQEVNEELPGATLAGVYIRKDVRGGAVFAWYGNDRKGWAEFACDFTSGAIHCDGHLWAFLEQYSFDVPN